METISRPPIVIADINLSHAWGRAFQELMQPGEARLTDLVVSVASVDGGPPLEDYDLRQSIDDYLFRLKGFTTETVASTIFPRSMWNVDAPREQLYERYKRALPALKKADARNANGIYFERLINFGPDEKGEKEKVNQLDHIITTYKPGSRAGNRRPTALQAAIFDPTKDHSHQRRKGFPCLQQVAFTRQGAGGLAVTGFYGAQYLFERGYGNYLGLYNLGLFMAHELGLRFTQMNCIAATAMAKGNDINKGELTGLLTIVKDAL